MALSEETGEGIQILTHRENWFAVEYRKRKKMLEEELTEYEQQLKSQSAAPVQEKAEGLNWKAIRETLNELIDFSQPKVDNKIDFEQALAFCEVGEIIKLK